MVLIISMKVDILRFSLCKFITYIYSLIMDIEHNLKIIHIMFLNKYLTWIISKKLSIRLKGCSFRMKNLG